MKNYSRKVSNKRKKSKSRSKRSRRVSQSLKKGSLKRYGYSVHDSKEDRRKSLKKAVKKYGYSSLIKKLNYVKVLSKSTSPSNSKIYGQDIKYLQKKKFDGTGEPKFFYCRASNSNEDLIIIISTRKDNEEVNEWFKTQVDFYNPTIEIKELQHRDDEDFNKITSDRFIY
jgi:hypothetical protein